MADAEVVPHAHRQALGKQICHAQHEHGHWAERSSRDAGNDRKPRNHAVICPVNEISNVVSCCSEDAPRVHVQRPAVREMKESSVFILLTAGLQVPPPQRSASTLTYYVATT